MDEDLGTLGAKIGLIKAISETQSDHTARLTRPETGQDELRTKLDLVHVGVETIQTLLTGLAPDDGDGDALP